MRICILGEYFYPDSTGGSGTILSKLVRHLKDTYGDLEVDVVTSRNLFRGEAGVLTAREDWEGVNIIRLSAPEPPKKSMRRRLQANLIFTFKTFKFLLTQRRKYDLMMVVTAPPTLPLAAKLYGFLSRTPYVYLVYDLYLDMAVAMNMVPSTSRLINKLRKIQRSWFHAAARTVVLGRCMQEHIETAYGLGRHRMGVVPIPANIDFITPRSKITNFREENNLDGFVVLYAGNFARYQDFDTLLDAAALMRERSDVTWVFVGDGAKREHIEGRIEKENLTNVRLLPFVPENQLPDMLAAADVSLVTLEKGIEGLAVPSKFYNIMASGRPTLACVPQGCEVARVVQESNCGLWVEQESPLALAGAVEKLADDPHLLEAMGLNARRVCEERFGLAAIGQQFYAIFHEVVLAHGTKRPRKNSSDEEESAEKARKHSAKRAAHANAWNK